MGEAPVPEEGLVGVADSMPSNVFSLSAVPNPFNPATTISYSITEGGNVKLDVYTAGGKFVKTLVNENREAGTYGVSWNGTDSKGKKLSSGIYLVRISSKSGFSSSKITMLK